MKIFKGWKEKNPIPWKAIYLSFCFMLITSKVNFSYSPTKDGYSVIYKLERKRKTFIHVKFKVGKPLPPPPPHYFLAIPFLSHHRLSLCFSSYKVSFQVMSSLLVIFNWSSLLSSSSQLIFITVSFIPLFALLSSVSWRKSKYSFAHFIPLLFIFRLMKLPNVICWRAIKRGMMMMKQFERKRRVEIILERNLSSLLPSSEEVPLLVSISFSSPYSSP